MLKKTSVSSSDLSDDVLGGGVLDSLGGQPVSESIESPRINLISTIGPSSATPTQTEINHTVASARGRNRFTILQNQVAN